MKSRSIFNKVTFGRSFPFCPQRYTPTTAWSVFLPPYRQSINTASWRTCWWLQFNYWTHIIQIRLSRAPSTALGQTDDERLHFVCIAVTQSNWLTLSPPRETDWGPSSVSATLGEQQQQVDWQTFDGIHFPISTEDDDDKGTLQSEPPKWTTLFCRTPHVNLIMQIGGYHLRTYLLPHGNGDLINFAICGIYLGRIISWQLSWILDLLKYNRSYQRSKRVLRLEWKEIFTRGLCEYLLLAVLILLAVQGLRLSPDLSHWISSICIT